MSYNDRLREAALWVSAHPGDTVEVPKDALALALWEAAQTCQWPTELADWVRDPAHRASSHWSQQCEDAAVPTPVWKEEIQWRDDPTQSQPDHTDCTGQTWRGDRCSCPCHTTKGEL